jgi:hypothetical protein
VNPQFHPAPGDVANIEGFPVIGKWMIAHDLSYAHWLGARYDGKNLREPINIIIIKRFGHSGGYYGWLCGRLFPQVPSGKRGALSNEPFEFHNNHGRFFGPCLWNGRFYWTGAVSREKMDPASKAKHEFISFKEARDQFARALVERADFRIETYQSLDNAILNDLSVGTGDHDGLAVVLIAPR